MKVLLVDDHRMMRAGLRVLLERERDLHVVGEASEGHAALELCASLRPDIVVMDIGMSGLNGIETTRRLTATLPQARVVALTMHPDRRYVQAMFEAGAWGYLVKTSAPEELIFAMRSVLRGEKYVSPGIANAVVESIVGKTSPPRGVPQAELSQREREVLRLLAEGLTSKEISSKLDVAVSTIDSHRKQIMAKLNLRSVAELTKFAIRAGLTSLE